MPISPCTRLFAAILSLALLPLLAACSSGGGSSASTQPTASTRLIQSATEADLESRLKAELVKRYQRLETGYYYGGLKEGRPLSPTEAGGYVDSSGIQSQTAGSTASLTHSETNVQEAGVDEGDLVKTDGNFIYLARGSRFLVLKAQPAEQMAVVSDIDLQEQINELYLDNGRVTLITAPFSYPVIYVGAGGTIPVSRPVTRVYLYNVSSPTSPSLKAKYEFPGIIQGSRRIDNAMYVVTNHSIDLPNPVNPWDYLPLGPYDWAAFNEASAKATAENLKRIEALTLADLIPTYSRTTYNEGVAGATTTAPVVAGGDVSFPESGNGTDLTLVIALDTTTAAPVVSCSGILSSWCRLYMSADALYLASGNKWFWIQPVAGAAVPPANPEPSTAVHKFSVAKGSAKPVYRGSGAVNGWLNNQFSMGEYNGYLRIGTTRGGWWGEGISNQLSIMGEESGKLVETGRIEGIAPGERIYSMRFDRDRGYMVTFRQTDPLFTFDLSNPRTPRKVGHIEVDGFATYIQIIGPNNSRLLTVGQSATSAGQVTGNKLQLFDVSNLAEPQLLGQFELGSGWSDALYDHHAFLYYEPLGLLTIPYHEYDYTGYSSALRVFGVSGSGIEQRGTIPASVVTAGYGEYRDTVDRAVIIGTDIYAVAHRSVTVAGAALLDIKKQVLLPEGYGYYPVTLPGGLPGIEPLPPQ